MPDLDLTLARYRPPRHRARTILHAGNVTLAVAWCARAGIGLASDGSLWWLAVLAGWGFIYSQWLRMERSWREINATRAVFLGQGPVPVRRSDWMFLALNAAFFIVDLWLL